MQQNNIVEIAENSFTLLPNSLPFSSQTKIIVTQQSLFETNKQQRGIIVIGKNQQKISSPGLESFEDVGEVQSFLDKTLYEKDDDSASDDDTYKPYPYHPGHQRKIIKVKEQQSRNVLVITEPCITEYLYIHKGKAISHFKYDVIRNNTCLSFNDEDAIAQASKDLTFCYTETLKRGLPILRYNTTERSISFPTLSADVGFLRDKAARIAIAAVFDFIKNNPNKYHRINFFVKKRSDFALYSRLLLQRTKLFQNICLFYGGHKDKGNILSWLPEDLVNYIMNLILSLLPEELRDYITNLI